MNSNKNFSISLPTKDESYFLKLLAIFLMTIDHIGLILFPGILWLRIIGRLAFPIFAYQFAVSLNSTRHLKKMGINLLIFSVLSQLVYYFIDKNPFELNIFFTLFVGWLVYYLLKNIGNLFLKILSLVPIFAFLLLPFFIHNFPQVDYGLYGVLILISFAFFIKLPLTMNIVFVFLTLSFCFFSSSYLNLSSYIQAFCLFSIPLFYLRFPTKLKFSNIFYYLYYPLHLAILLILRTI